MKTKKKIKAKEKTLNFVINFPLWVPQKKNSTSQRDGDKLENGVRVYKRPKKEQCIENNKSHWLKKIIIIFKMYLVILYVFT